MRVLPGVEDHWAAKAELDRLAAAGATPRGIAWFTAADVWHAVDHGMLEVNLWHGSTANVAPGDALLTAVSPASSGTASGSVRRGPDRGRCALDAASGGRDGARSRSHGLNRFLIADAPAAHPGWPDRSGSSWIVQCCRRGR